MIRNDSGSRCYWRKKILTALDAVIDYFNITDKTDYYLKTSLLAGTGHPNGYIETILNYYKICVYRSYQYAMKQILRTVIHLGYLVMKMAYNQTRGGNNES